MKVFLKRTFYLCFMLTFTIASAQSFAAFTVEPNGDEEFDIVTEISTLPDGGLVIDEDSGITITGDFITYKEGDFVEVEGAAIDGKFGNMIAPSVYVDLEENTLSAFGEVNVITKNLDIETTDLFIYLDPSIIIAEDQVVSLDPPFEGNGTVFDAEAQQGFLLPPYNYQDGLFLLRSDSEKLQLTWFEETDGNTVFETTDDINQQLYTKLSPFIP